MSALRWAILTGEYPPQPGGVSDHARLLARRLAQAGDEAHVWAPAFPGESPKDKGVHVHRLPGSFGLRGLARLDRELRALGLSPRILVQYVPQAFGYRGMNLPLCLWLWLRGRRQPVWVMFHEVAMAMGRGRPLRNNLLGGVHRAMAWLLLRAARRVFISIPAWKDILAPLVPGGTRLEWLPLSSNLPTSVEEEEVRRLRKRIAPPPRALLIGHFTGTYGNDFVRSMLDSIIPPMLCAPGRLALLLGGGNQEFAQSLARRHPALDGRLLSPGYLAPKEAAMHMAACDLLVLPYPDGASTRRTTLMAGLALGLPVVTTRGELTEPFWEGSGAVLFSEALSPEAVCSAVEKALADEDLRGRLSARAMALYREKFDIEKTALKLRAVSAP